MSYKFSLLDAICMKCQILFSRKNKQSIIKSSSVELAQRVVKVKMHTFVTFKKLRLEEHLSHRC